MIPHNRPPCGAIFLDARDGPIARIHRRCSWPVRCLITGVVTSAKPNSESNLRRRLKVARQTHDPPSGMPRLVAPTDKLTPRAPLPRTHTASRQANSCAGECGPTRPIRHRPEPVTAAGVIPVTIGIGSPADSSPLRTPNPDSAPSVNGAESGLGVRSGGRQSGPQMPWLAGFGQRAVKAAWRSALHRYPPNHIE